MSARLDGTCVIMDNLLLGGSSDEEHLRNLEAVFVQFNGNVGYIDQLHTQVVNARSSPIRAHWQQTLELVAEL